MSSCGIVWRVNENIIMDGFSIEVNEEAARKQENVYSCSDSHVQAQHRRSKRCS